MESSRKERLDRIKDPAARAIFDKHLPSDAPEKPKVEAANESPKGPPEELIKKFGREAAWRMWREAAVNDAHHRRQLGEDY